MTISKAQIFNIVLNLLGVSTPLENPNSSDNKAILLNNYYPLAKDYVLKDFDWNFACSYRELAKSYCEDNIFNFKYIYDYPNDCLCARDLYNKNANKPELFKVSSLSNGDKVILTDAIDPILRYTKRIDKEAHFTSEFSMALAYYLASLTSGVITGSIQKGEMAFEKYIKFIKHARLMNAQEGNDLVFDDGNYLDSRS